MIKQPLHAGIRLLFLSLLIIGTFAARADADKLAPAEVRPVLDFDFPTSPEGVAVDKRGNIYVGVRLFDFAGMVTRSAIVRIRRNGQVSVFANLPDIAGISLFDPAVGAGILGLAADHDDNIYAAFDSRVDATKGVWRVDRNGENLARLAGSEGMIFPNFLTLDDDGNLYASDSFGGSIWRFPEPAGSVSGALWVQDAGLLQPTFVDSGFGILPGINGIAFFPPDNIYAANTDKNLVARVGIAPNGDAEPPQFVAGVPVPDGIAVDENGEIYTVIPAGPLFGLPPVAKIDRATFGFVPIVVDPAGFDFPLSLAFGRGDGKRNVLVTNGALLGPGFGAGPNLLEVGIGVKGYDPFADEDEDGGDNGN